MSPNQALLDTILARATALSPLLKAHCLDLAARYVGYCQMSRYELSAIPKARELESELRELVDSLP